MDSEGVEERGAALIRRGRTNGPAAAILALTAVALAIAVGVGSMPRPAHAQPPELETLPDALDYARDAFIYGDYSEVIDVLAPRLLPEPPPLGTDELFGALTVLGVSAYLEGQIQTSEQAFLQILLRDPTFRPDPLLYPAEVITFFDDVRTLHAAELPTEERRASESTVYLETRVREQSRFVSMLPFGYGFFAAGEREWGTVYLLSQSSLAATSLTMFWLNEADRLANDGFTQTPSLANRRRTVQITTAVVFYALVVTNAIHGALAHDRFSTVRYRTLDEAPSEATPPARTGAAIPW